MLRLIALALAICTVAGGAEAKTFKIKPGPDAAQQIAAALAQAGRGDQITLKRGRYDLTAPISVTADRVTLRGEGADRTILSFQDQIGGAAAVTASGDESVLRDFGVEDPRGDGVLAVEANNATLSGLRVEWTAGPRSGNGGRGIAVSTSQNVLLDKLVVRGASASGIYIGQSKNVILRRSRAEQNVVGIQAENSAGVDISKNAASRNTIGILINGAPGAPAHEAAAVRVVENEIVQNNTANFAPDAAFFAALPVGVGIEIMAARDVHLIKNTIGEHGAANVFITSYPGSIASAGFNALPRDVMVRNNTFGRVGFAPGAEWSILPSTYGTALPDILWDGAGAYVAGGTPRSAAVRIGVSENVATRSDPVSFLSLGLPFASSPTSEMQPDPSMPSPLILPEPPAVKLR